MPVTKLTCPSCSAVLKSSGTLPAGVSVKCPKCTKSITVPAEAPPELDGFEPIDETPPKGRLIASFRCSSCSALLKLAQPIPAGKSIKCPKCAKVIQVPAEQAKPAPTKPLPIPIPKPPPDDDVIDCDVVDDDAPKLVSQVRCASCSASLKLGRPIAEGKNIKCPKCGKVVPVKAEDPAASSPADQAGEPEEGFEYDLTGEEAEPLPSPAKKRRQLEADGTEDEEGRPRRKAGTSRARIWGLVGGGGALVLIVGLVVLLTNRGSSLVGVWEANEPATIKGMSMEFRSDGTVIVIEPERKSREEAKYRIVDGQCLILESKGQGGPQSARVRYELAKDELKLTSEDNEITKFKRSTGALAGTTVPGQTQVASDGKFDKVGTGAPHPPTTGAGETATPPLPLVPVGSVTGDSRDTLARDALGTITRAVALLKSIKDERTAKAAVPQAQAIRGEMIALDKRLDKLGKPTAMEAEKLRKYDAAAVSLTAESDAEVKRLNSIPGGDKIVEILFGRETASARQPPETPAASQGSLVGAWDRIGSEKGGIAWAALDVNLRTARSLRLEFFPNGKALIYPNGVGGVSYAASYSSGASGVVEFTYQAVSVPVGGKTKTPPPPARKLKVKAIVTPDELTLTDDSGKADKFRRAAGKN